ncbi:hypothetical protein A5731_20695 [Mycolicibacterium conceptionense]|uniref:PASTA domain-containing protein n=2 Tax=Mycolicibacterium TaxID=1866885 RepID=A0A1A1Y454_9MYCO|nr:MULTISPECIES: hypothetical protein [Mycolicibacterium]MCW1824467.1 hypothetical protein [Mycolicibacterium senegalense]OBB06303.1 hypothetical protein A5718_20180 [Mycolicibacterium conceptionense]OBE99708.1 hypothetical protein A5731_20695 [Mycolicibacterium conceptionense]OBF26093.1 hypothetical protein A5726_06420 [Mycolicibacterium conceptionense]OBF43168.1 hypothetical protein A5720_13375 [Mycolicibacterium conceptionense]
MRVKWSLLAVTVAVFGAIGASSAVASAETAQETINRLQSEGYTVTIDKIGTAPLDHCTVTSVRNPQQVSQLVPYVGPGLGGDRILVPSVTSRTVSVSLNCQR